MMKIRRPLTGLVPLLCLSICCQAQSNGLMHDGVGWLRTEVRVHPVAQVAIEGALNYRVVEYFTQMQSGVATASLGYSPGKSRSTFSLTYGVARLKGTGKADLIQLSALQRWSWGKSKPFARLTADWIDFTAVQSNDQVLPITWRYRLLASIVLPVHQNRQLITSQEFFLIRQGAGWLKENRAQLGLRQQISRVVQIELSYLNRLRQGRIRDRMEHNLLVNLLFQILSKEGKKASASQ